MEVDRADLLRASGRARLCLVGGFGLFVGSRPLAVPATAQRVLAIVALSERAVPRPVVAAQVWPDSSERQAAADLRSTLWRLRRIRPGIVSSVGDRLQLESDLEVDVHELSALAGRLRRGSLEAEVPVDLIDRFNGDLLPGWYQDWVLVERERFRQVRLHSLERLCELFIGARRAAEAIDAGLAAVAGEPLRETAQQALIAAYLAEGNRVEARRQYESYRQLLWRELGLEPGEQLAALVADCA